jgi:D-sedoheptulose 7-phosphate isomerase
MSAGASAGHEIDRIAADFLDDFANAVSRVDLEAVGRVTRRLDEARARGATIYIAGNGGSAMIASHWVNDLGKATKAYGNPPMRVMSLSDNVSWLTALANDEGYERVFTGQLENFAAPGDVLMVISSSGNSTNLVRAVELAKNRGVESVALVGFSGGKLKEMADDVILVASQHGAYGLVESAHEMICHMITKCLAEAKPMHDGSAMPHAARG